MRRFGISPSFLDDPENRRAAAPVTEMLERAAADSSCDHFGLLMAQCRTFASLGPLSLLLQHLRTVGDILEALNQYRRLMNDIFTLERIQGEDSSVFCWIVAPGFDQRQIVELAMGAGYRIMTELLRGRWAPELVHFRRSAPADLRPFERFFSVPIEFDSKFDGYSCPTASLDTAVPHSDAAMAENARRLLELMPLAGEHAPISDAAQRAITLHLPSGGARLESVAANLGMNPRTFQRRLALEGSSFEAMLNATRRDVAVRLLAGTAKPIGFVAEMLGYAGTGAFSRWFLSEFGQSPSSWRKAQRELLI